MPTPVVHFEIHGTQGSNLADFYSTMFGWTVNADNPHNYGMVEPGGPGPDAPGIMGAILEQDQTNVVIYIQVDDPAASLKKVGAAGGKVVQDVTVIPGMVTMALFQDPAGNVMGLVASETPAGQ